MNELDKWLNRMLKKGEQDGRNRRTSAQSKGSAPEQPNPRPGRSGAQGTNYRALKVTIGPGQSAGKSPRIDWQIHPYSVVFDPASLCWVMEPPDVSEKTMQERRRLNKWAPAWMHGHLGRPNAARTWTPRLIQGNMEADGVIAGEIIAWRAWHWNGHALRSIFVDYEWPTKRPAKGQVANGYGIHAYKTLPACLAVYNRCLDDVIIGEVAMWGDVVEYETGYVSEFARIHSVHRWPNKKTERAVSELYGIKEQP